MVCSQHTHQNGVNTCSQCGEWLCEDCSVQINGRIICKKCIAANMATGTREKTTAHPIKEPVNFGLLFIFACIMPGLTYMYMGLIKRGLFFMSAFFSIIALLAVTHYGLISFLIPILWITSIFDSFNKRRQINSGAYVPDSVEDILGWFRAYRSPVLMAICLLLFWRFASHGGFYPGLPIAALCIGLHFLLKSRRKKDKNEQNER